MVGTQDLNGTWKVYWSDGVHGASNVPHEELLDEGRYLDVPVPMDLHTYMQQEGRIGDPREGINTLSAQWVSQMYWQYRRTFMPDKAVLKGSAWLVFDRLDLHATILLNGEEIGRHINAHRARRIDVTGKLKAGENALVVLIDSGLHYVADKEGAAYQEGLEWVLNKRHHLRKPQCQFGWDWNAKLINVGITGGVRLEYAQKARLDQVMVWHDLAEDHATAAVTVRAFIEGLSETHSKGRVSVRVAETGQETAAQVHIGAGLNSYEVRFDLPQPELWWPIGHGTQHRYTFEITVEAGGEEIARTERRVGIRSIRLNRSPHPEEGEYFIIEVNGRPIFCKGGNWVPPDLIYGEITAERMRELVHLAVEANFNLLRIWGGGLYADHDLLDACDAAGILVWHDFLFACSKYPGDDPWFLAEIRHEVTWAVREYGTHPSLAVWCGNNELEWGTFEWGYDASGKSLPDYALYHHVIPVILRGEDPVNRPYWPSSPYSPNYGAPNDPTVGDQHPWDVTLRLNYEDFWAYRDFVDRFPNEGGVLGASSPATLRQFLPEGERSLRSFTWDHHDNTVNFWKPGTGVAYRMHEYWLGRPYTEFTFDDYCFASALLHAEGLGEYINNYRRRMFSSACAVFWMYNDSWPVSHGWTIVDYYRRKKLAYHPVRRAFAPISVVVAEHGGEVVVFGVNDSPGDAQATLRYGYFATAGGLPVDQTLDVALPANQSVPLAKLDRAQWDQLGVKTHGAFATLESGGVTLAQHKLLIERFKDLAWAKPEIQAARRGTAAVFSSDVFAWGVTLDLDGESAVPDNCFDLIPGVSYTVEWPECLPAPKVLRCGNELLT